MPAAPGELKWYRKFSYSVGHVLNDLCASIWFSYGIVLFQKVDGLGPDIAGYLILLGQIADGICTVFVGYESDKSKNGFRGYGARKTWHLIGTFCVMVMFPLILLGCFMDCQNAEKWYRFFYTAPMIIIFQFGWASMQISHLALIPSLTPDESVRVQLNAFRNAFTVLSNLSVYAAMWILLDVHLNANVRKSKREIGPDDLPTFQILGGVVTAIGLIFCLIFHLGTKEPAKNEVTNRHRTQVTWRDWLKDAGLYQVGLIYMCSRLVVNISQTYLVYYITDALQLKEINIAVIPMVTYGSGFLASFLMKWTNKKIGRHLTYVVGGVFCLGAYVWMYLLAYTETNHESVYGAAVILGIGTSTVLVTSLSMTADLIGDNTESGAFVYGTMSFGDKLANGDTIVFVPATAALFALALVGVHWLVRGVPRPPVNTVTEETVATEQSPLINGADDSTRNNSIQQVL